MIHRFITVPAPLSKVAEVQCRYKSGIMTAPPLEPYLFCRRVLFEPKGHIWPCYSADNHLRFVYRLLCLSQEVQVDMTKLRKKLTNLVTLGLNICSHSSDGRALGIFKYLNIYIMKKFSKSKVNYRKHERKVMSRQVRREGKKIIKKEG
jgi:hypothetical protein